MLTDMEILLVEPGRHHLGCGVVHFIGFLQVTSVSLHIYSCYHGDVCCRIQTYQQTQLTVVRYS